MFSVSNQKDTITGAFLNFRSCSCKVNSAEAQGTQGSGFSLSLTAAHGECRSTHLRIGFGLMFPAVV